MLANNRTELIRMSQFYWWLELPYGWSMQINFTGWEEDASGKCCMISPQGDGYWSCPRGLVTTEELINAIETMSNEAREAGFTAPETKEAQAVIPGGFVESEIALLAKKVRPQ